MDDSIQKRLPFVFLIVIVVISFITKFFVLNNSIVPPSPDYGNYLTQVGILNGHDVTGMGLRYNPIFFIFLNGIIQLTDTFTALKICAAFVFSIAAIPFFMLAKKFSSSNFTALICTCFFIFFEGYSEMISWGGNPNFLAFSFMLFSLYFLLISFEMPSKKNLFLTGLFFSLVIGTHFLVATFTFLWFSIFLGLIVISKKNVIGSSKVLLVAILLAVALSFPYVNVYLSFFSESSKTLVTTNLVQIAEITSTFQWLFRASALMMLVFTILGIIGLSFYIRKNIIRGLTLVSLFLTPLVFIMLTEQPGRWFYFLPIPIVLSFSIFLGSLFAQKNKAWKKARFFLVPFIIIIMISSTVLSIERQENASAYYQSIGKSELQALNWLRENTSSNSMVATSGPNKIIGGDIMPGSSYSWWVEGYSQRKCISTGFTKWFTFSDEQSDVTTANRIFAGSNTFEAGNIGVSENFPNSDVNPAIGTIINGEYQNLVSFNDAEQELVFSPKNNQSLTLTDSLFHASDKTSSIQSTYSKVNATYQYSFNQLKIIRSTVIQKDSNAVDIYYTIPSSDFIIRQFNIKIWSSNFTTLQNYHTSNSSVTLYQKTAMNDAQTNISVLQTNSNLNISVTNKDSKYFLPVVTLTLSPTQDNLNVHIRIKPNSNTQPQTKSVQSYNSNNLIKESGVQYIFINKIGNEEYRRFLDDSKNFVICFENSEVAIFKVKQEIVN
jgi:hypothetical protein